MTTTDLAVDTTALEPTVIHVGRLSSVLVRGLLLLGEAVAVPGAILYAFITAGRPMAGLIAVFVWRSGCIAGRALARVSVPATCWLTFALFIMRTVAGLAVSSVSLYLVIPVAMCAGQGLFFLVSARAERSVLMRLADDYTEDIPDGPALRALFAQLSGVWGGVHLICAGVGAWAVTLSATHAVAVTSALAIGCPVTSAAGCVAWGLWRASRMPSLRIVFCEERGAPALPRPVDEVAVARAA